VVALKFRTDYEMAPGQWCWITVKEIDASRKPFSVVYCGKVAEGDKARSETTDLWENELHIQIGGSWTNNLYSLLGGSLNDAGVFKQAHTYLFV
jgi:hypothetical protein